MTRPVTRVDNWILAEGGYSRPLTLWERFTLWLGVRNTVKIGQGPRPWPY